VAGTTVFLGNTVVYTVPPTLKEVSFFPAPGSTDKAWIMPDLPRFVPPAWGATPPPSSFLGSDSGWDLNNQAPDVYVFLNQPGQYQAMRRDFLKLTGPTPLPPLFIFGFTDSRYHPYTEQEALDSIDTYRKKQIPLDMFVVDTDWRVNGSHGYTPEPKYFPDMPRFLTEAHQRNVRIMFNDHPEPQTDSALDPKELQYRWKGLSTLMDEGVNVWWYDRNWGVSLKSPLPNLRHEAWGQREYHDMTAGSFPDRRPLIMSNVDGIDGGFRHYAPHPASHTFPIWWTGDTPAQWDSLQRAVANGVDEGIIGFLPYVNDDLGGHYNTPDAELYTRYLQYGCLCPITRVHCTRGQDRHPWAFGPDAEKIVTDFIRLRYRLLPTIYSAAHQNYVDGTPLLRRLDWYWPKFKEAGLSDEYLLGEDLLIAPITDSIAGQDKTLPASLLHTPTGALGLKAEYFANQDLTGTPTVTRTDPTVKFDWGDQAPMKEIPQTHFSARWTGTLGPLPRSGIYRFSTVADDGVRVYLDGKAIIDEWHDSDSERHQASVQLEKGSTHQLRVEFYQNTGQSRCTVLLGLPTKANQNAAIRKVWLPPGEWQDAWTGIRTMGPQELTVHSALWHMPMWIRDGGVIALTPVVQHTTDAWWSNLTLDAYAPTKDGTLQRRIYADDGISNAYQTGGGASTLVDLKRAGQDLTFTVEPATGSLRIPTVRRLTLRLHLAGAAASVTISGLTGQLQTMSKDASGKRMPLMGQGESARNGEVQVLEVTGMADVRRPIVVQVKLKDALVSK
jgi:hypothetical protein